VAIYRALAGGVTSAQILHGSANSVGGQSALVKLKYGISPPRAMLIPDAPRHVKFALGENPKQSNWGQNRGKRFPNTRMGVEAVFRRAFAEARAYEEARRRDPLVRRDLRLEALADILRGDLRVQCHSYRADEILMFLDVARDFGLRPPVFQHVLEGYRVAPELAAAGAGASTFSDWWSYKIEAYEAIPHNAALLTRAGVLTSVNSDSPEQIRHLNVEAAKAVKYGGLSETEALALVTLHPARQLGIDDRVGSIEPGKDADLAFYNGHPLSSYSRCVLTLIEGEVYFEDRSGPVPATAAFRLEARPRRDRLPLPRGPRVAIVNARVHPVILPPFRGNVLIDGGKIVGLGPDVRPPDGFEILDAEGLSVYPGLIDPLTAIGLLEIGSVAGTRDDAEIGEIQPDLRAITAVNPHSEHVAVTRANGITAALVVPQGGKIAGQSAIVRLDGWVPAEMSVRDVFALHVHVPPRRDGEANSKEEDVRRLKDIRDVFREAQRAAAGGGGRDPRLDALAPYLRKERPVVFHAQSAQEIREALELAAEFGLRPVIAGGREAWKVADLLAEKNVPVILAGVLQLPLRDHDPYDAVFANPARLAKAGVRFAISAAEIFSGNSRNTPYHAAWAAAYGLDREEALRAVTVYPAMILEVSETMGSLTPGKDADLIVTTGDPLEVVTDVVAMFIRGRAVPLESKHTRLYEKFRRRLEERNAQPR
jgi:imidazolonepropionase-like amidohydrolase